MTKNSMIALGIGGLILVVVIYLAAKSGTPSTPSTTITSTPQSTASAQISSTPTPGSKDAAMDNTKLQMTDTVIGTGAEAKQGSTVSVQYVGTLMDGTKFDSSRDRNQPFSFTIGQGQVIQGWEQGLVGMKVGGQRKLVIPPSLGYGAQATGPIPANSTLNFDIELLSVK